MTCYPPVASVSIRKDTKMKKAPWRGRRNCMERVTGIEPAWSAWKAEVLPLNYTRVNKYIQ